MNKKIIIASVLFIVLASFMIISSSKNEPKNKENESSIILFYGDTCPHCKIVDDYIKENNVEEKINFVQKEVYRSKANSLEMRQKAEICGLKTDSIGVPFLFDGENGAKCLIGDRDIIDYFASKI